MRILKSWAFLLAFAASALGVDAETTNVPPSAPLPTPVASPVPVTPVSKYPSLRPGLFNSLYAYNGENGAPEVTRVTLTYFEDLFQPFLQIKLSEAVQFKVGAGLVMPLNQEQKIRSWFPYFQTKLSYSDWSLDLGSLDGNHDFPAPLLDPLVNLIPQIRINSSTQIPIGYENFDKTGKFTHGLYEYGLAFKWFETPRYRGEAYLNWQLPDTPGHRERFDMGLTQRAVLGGIPLYAAVHYWHNGGHENPHPVVVTENYTGAIGARNDDFSALVLGSILLPDREGAPDTHPAALAAYLEYHFRWGGWVLTPNVFISDELRNNSNKFISVEGDPFFRAPFYLGFNVQRKWQIVEGCDLTIGFVNGVFQRYAREKFSPGMLRYDQMIRVNVHYLFGKE